LAEIQVTVADDAIFANVIREVEKQLLRETSIIETAEVRAAA